MIVSATAPSIRGLTPPARRAEDNIRENRRHHHVIRGLVSAGRAAGAGRGGDRRVNPSTGGDGRPHGRAPAPAARPAAPNRDEFVRRVGREIARLDAAISAQVNAILHHPALQKLEASWRGLHYLVSQVPEGANIKVRVLDVSWRELARDLGRAIEFDQSQLFKKVYSEEYDTPGGEPFGVLLADYEVRHRMDSEHRTDDLAALRSAAGVAAAAFAPFVAAAHPALLDLTEFAELELPLNLARTFDQAEYLAWNAFRETEDARFVGLTLPRVLMRPPYRDDGARVDGFRFREEAAGPDRENYLWGNAAYAFGAVLVRAFAESGWFAAIRGEAGGLVPGWPPRHSASTGRAWRRARRPTPSSPTPWKKRSENSVSSRCAPARTRGSPPSTAISRCRSRPHSTSRRRPPTPACRRCCSTSFVRRASPTTSR